MLLKVKLLQRSFWGCHATLERGFLLMSIMPGVMTPVSKSGLCLFNFICCQMLGKYWIIYKRCFMINMEMTLTNTGWWWGLVWQWGWYWWDGKKGVVDSSFLLFLLGQTDDNKQLVASWGMGDTTYTNIVTGRDNSDTVTSLITQETPTLSSA